MSSKVVMYGIWDEARRSWVEGTIGVPYEECLYTGYQIIGKGKLPPESGIGMLKFLLNNLFDIRPIGEK